ncbi:DoxX family protein [Kitasatospora sp. NBC_01539]|uniref:DoxX family protein n=1 Tax=Kitasatospora sp. NBC_01539 TaxID=2903577 RepID=UPI00386019C9
MFVLYVAVTLLCVAATAMSGVLDLARYERITVSMAAAGVPASWLAPLGVLKTAAAAGLLAGFAVPLPGTAAAIGLVLFFVGAIAVHLRSGDRSFGLALGFLLLAAATLAAGVAEHGLI